MEELAALRPLRWGDTLGGRARGQLYKPAPPACQTPPTEAAKHGGGEGEVSERGGPLSNRRGRRRPPPTSELVKLATPQAP